MADLDDLAAEKRRAYKRNWARRNRDKCNQYVKNYWLRKAAQELENCDCESEEPQKELENRDRESGEPQ